MLLPHFILLCNFFARLLCAPYICSPDGKGPFPFPFPALPPLFPNRSSIRRRSARESRAMFSEGYGGCQERIAGWGMVWKLSSTRGGVMAWTAFPDYLRKNMKIIDKVDMI